MSVIALAHISHWPFSRKMIFGAAGFDDMVKFEIQSLILANL
jgi:hypothetical protein